MWVPAKIRNMIRGGATQQEVAAEVRLHLEQNYPEHIRPTLLEWVKVNLSDIRRWANPPVEKVVEAFILSKSSDPAIADKYTTKLAQYRNRYEAVENKFGEYE